MTIYLDNAATSYPKPKEVWLAMDKAREFAVNAGRGSHRLSRKAAEMVYIAREKLAELFNINDPKQIAFTQNATMGLNMGIKGIVSKGDEIVISNMEHNSVYRPAVNSGARINFAKADKYGEISAKSVLNALTRNTKLVCVLHASNVTGGINNIREIGRLLKERNVIFMVDAAQSAGCVDINVNRDNIDILVFPGHKSLLGPSGTGGIYVREGIKLKTILEGGTGSMSEYPSQPDFFPDRLEAGTINLLGIAGLTGGVDFVLRNGAENIGDAEKYFCSMLYSELANLKNIKLLGPTDRNKCTGALSFSAQKDAGEIAYLLDRDYDIAVRSGLHCAPLAAKTLGINGSVRLSCGPFTRKEDIEKAAYAVKKITE